MPQIDLITYGSTVSCVYLAFWFYFVCSVVATTIVFQRAVFSLFFGYSCLIPVYTKWIGIFSVSNNQN